MKATPVPQRSPRPGPSALEQKVDRVEQDLRAHVGDDQDQFGQLRDDIRKLGESLGKRIDQMGDELQGQITTLTLDKAKAEGRAEGIASIKAAISAPKWWQPLVIGLATLLAGAVLTGTGWLVASLIHQMQGEIDALKNRPVASVTVSPSNQQPMTPAPIQVSPPIPSE